jgi:SAM-dependent methyltransferase
MVTHISRRHTQFSYFDQLLEGAVWKDRKILDFGGNVGGFLVGAGNHVDHDDYWCLDLTEAAIQQGRCRFPRGHFVHYNRYSSYFNPDGVRYLPVPDLGLTFDIILAFSVFTHTHQNEMLGLVEQLRKMLAIDGVLAFTFCVPRVGGVAETVNRVNWCVVVGGDLYVEPGNELCQQERRSTPGESYCSYFTADYMASIFPGAQVHPPVSPEWQHCCVLKNGR